MPEDETLEELPDPTLDRILRVVTTAILIFGGGYLALEFTYWLTHGGFQPFLLGSAFIAALFFLLIIWARILARGVSSLRTRPLIFALFGLATALGILAQHFWLS
ncbi:MAG: hypothetical protein AAGC74_05785 [Verrucomicrobiota bacterium]